MKKSGMRKALLFGLITAIIVPVSAYAAEETNGSKVFDMSIGIERMGGDSTYQIGGNIVYANGGSQILHFPLSELEWPLDTWLARLEAEVNLGESWRLNGVIKTDISDPDGNMKDSDWLTSSNPGRLDVYSESDISDFSALVIDLDAEWIFFKLENLSFYGGIGYQYQKFEYDGNLLHQYSPSGMPGFEFYGDGSVAIIYDVSYSMPYAKIGVEFSAVDNLDLQASFAYAPWVNADDEDNHVLRNRIATGDMDGDAYMFDMSGKYHFSPDWFVKLGFQYIKIDVDGTMDISLYGFTVLTEDETSESTQTSGYLTVGYTF